MCVLVLGMGSAGWTPAHEPQAEHITPFKTHDFRALPLFKILTIAFVHSSLESYFFEENFLLSIASFKTQIVNY